jgi:hypothetical protein
MKNATRRSATRVTSRAASLAIFLFFSFVAFEAAAIPIPIALDLNPIPLGSGWEQTKTGPFIPTYDLLPVGDHSVTISFDDSSKTVFDLGVTPNHSPLIPIQFLDGAVFTPRAGSTGTLIALGSDPFLYSGNIPGTGDILDYAFELYHPERFLYTYATGETTILDRRVLPPSTIPEPITISLLGLGLAGIGFSRKRQRG